MEDKDYEIVTDEKGYAALKIKRPKVEVKKEVLEEVKIVKKTTKKKIW